MNDLPGPEKPLPLNFMAALIAKEQAAPTASRPLYTPKRVRPRHRIAVMLHESGWRPKDIAKALGYTDARISVILNSLNSHLQECRSNFAVEVADNIKDVHSRLKLYANEMLDRLVAHGRQNNDPALSRLAARDILHMAGFTPVKKVFALDARVPFEELKKVVGAIAEANEVILNQDQWRVKEAKVAGGG